MLLYKEINICNAIRPEKPFKEFPIKESGTAWKIFSKNTDGILCPMLNHKERYHQDNDDIIQWNNDYSTSHKQGFCLVFLKKDAIKMLKRWKGINYYNLNFVIRKVEYKQALIKRTEPDETWDNPIVIIAKAFKPILEEGEYL